jgi:hypothetical protein
VADEEGSVFPREVSVINCIPSITAASNSINVAQIMIRVVSRLCRQTALAAETARTLLSLTLGRGAAEDCDPYKGNY